MTSTVLKTRYLFLFIYYHCQLYFQCWILFQDMFDPELYLSEYEAKDVKTGQNRLLTCRYRDATVCAEDDINFESTSTKNEERLSYFCVAIPGI